MTDCFAVLNEPRRPWIDPETLKVKFLALSAEAHPDRVHNAGESEKSAATRRYAELNTAYNCLRDPKERLAHLLELELGHRPREVQIISPVLADVFVEVAQLCRQTDGFLAEKGKITSPLLQLRAFERAQEWTGRLGALQTKLSRQREAITLELAGLDTAWTTAADATARATLLAGLEEVYRGLSYFARWGGQIQERIVRLSY